MSIIDLIGSGRESVTDRHELLNRCMVAGLVEPGRDENRKMMKLLQEARRECVIISTGEGYYIPTPTEQIEVEAYIAKEESRARNVNANLKYARKYLADIKAGRIV